MKNANKKKLRQSPFRILKNNLRMVFKVARLTPDYFITMISVFWHI